MVSYVKQMTAKVAFPEAAVTTTYIKPAKHTVASAACLLGGAVAIAAGLCLEKMASLQPVELLLLVVQVCGR